jgi:hypothetical protein
VFPLELLVLLPPELLELPDFEELLDPLPLLLELPDFEELLDPLPLLLELPDLLELLLLPLLLLPLLLPLLLLPLLLLPLLLLPLLLLPVLPLVVFVGSFGAGRAGVWVTVWPEAADANLAGVAGTTKESDCRVPLAAECLAD